MLVLFDIDGTLLHSLSAGVHAMTSTLRELHGIEPDFKQIEIHGRLDTLIWRDLSKIHGYPTDDASHANFRRTYGEHLDRRLAENNTVQRYPGAKELVDATLAVPGLTIGLLTGNYEHTGTSRCATRASTRATSSSTPGAMTATTAAAWCPWPCAAIRSCTGVPWLRRTW